MEPVRPTNGIDARTQQETIGIQSLYVDDTDLLWVGTEKSGVAFYGDNIYKFQSNFNGDITAIVQHVSAEDGAYENRIYCSDGELREQFVRADVPFDAQQGQRRQLSFAPFVFGTWTQALRWPSSRLLSVYSPSERSTL